MPAKLQAIDIRMEYYQPRTGNRVLAIENMNVTIEEGSFVSILGPSGCGKSTFLKIVDGLITPTRGKLMLDGHAISGPGKDRAMVFQDASLFPWYTVTRNVSYGLECLGVPAKQARERARPYIKLVGLEGFDGHYPYELSGGMQQRVNLARALAVNPELLLMDEPFAALDAQTRELMQAELLRVWNAERKTVMFITHQIDEAVYLSDRVIVMSARPGRIKLDRSVGLAHPRHYSVKTTPAFAGLKAELMEAVRTEVLAAQAQAQA